MTSTQLWNAPRIVPSLADQDVPRAVDWLSRAFGFHERTEARLSGQDFVLAWMELGDGLIHLQTTADTTCTAPKASAR
jgi:hypothetical protein